MEPEEDLVEETVMLTRRVRRQKRAEVVADADDVVDDGSDAIEDRTVAIDRRRPVGSGAADSDDENSDAIEDRTVAIDRRRPSGAGDSGADDGIDDSTRLIEDRTIAVERRRRPAPQDAPLDEQTVAVDRRRQSDADDSGSEDEELYETVRRAPASETVQPPAIYKPRAAPRTPHRPPVYPGDLEPTRVPDTGAVSVAKAGRRQSAFAVAAVGGASIVSIVGLVLLGFVVFA